MYNTKFIAVPNMNDFICGRSEEHITWRKSVYVCSSPFKTQNKKKPL